MQENFEADVARKSSQSPSSISSKKNESVDSHEMKLSLFKNSSSTLTNLMKSPNDDKSFKAMELKETKVDTIREVFVNLTKKEKLSCL